MRKSLLAAVAAVACATGLAMNAGAAQPAGDPAGSSSAQPRQQTSVSQAELRKFAATYQAVTAVRNQYMHKLQSAKDKQQAQKIADNAQQEMKATIKQHGFTLQQYGNVVDAINSNPQLNKQFQQMISSGGAGG